MDNKYRRSGAERRKDIATIEKDRRETADRRSVVTETDRTVNYMKKIPFFNGVTSDQIRKFLYICYNKTLAPDEFLFKHGDKSDAMYILLKGRVKLLHHTSTIVTTLEPYLLFGLSGMFTGDHRNLSAVSVEDSAVLKINKIELLRIFQGDISMSNRILLNIIVESSQQTDNFADIIHELKRETDV